jgi:hypothetical protein
MRSPRARSTGSVSVRSTAWPVAMGQVLLVEGARPSPTPPGRRRGRVPRPRDRRLRRGRPITAGAGRDRRVRADPHPRAQPARAAPRRALGLLRRPEARAALALRPNKTDANDAEGLAGADPAPRLAPRRAGEVLRRAPADPAYTGSAALLLIRPRRVAATRRTWTGARQRRTGDPRSRGPTSDGPLQKVGSGQPANMDRLHFQVFLDPALGAFAPKPR